MTREEAIKELQQGIPTENATDEECERYVEAYNIAIKALEQESSNDAISRQSVLNKIKEVCFSEEWVQFRIDKGSNGQRDFLINYIEQLPSVTSQSKIGHWIEYNESVERFDFTFGNWTEDILHRNCSECGKEVMVEETEVFNYCPFCGAKMEGE